LFLHERFLPAAGGPDLTFGNDSKRIFQHPVRSEYHLHAIQALGADPTQGVKSEWESKKTEILFGITLQKYYPQHQF